MRRVLRTFFCSSGVIFWYLLVVIIIARLASSSWHPDRGAPLCEHAWVQMDEDEAPACIWCGATDDEEAS